MSDTPSAVTLPPGVRIEAARETTQLGSNGQPINGMLFNLITPQGVTTSQFIAYDNMNNTALVEQLFAQRIASIQNVLNIAKS